MSCRTIWLRTAESRRGDAATLIARANAGRDKPVPYGAVGNGSIGRVRTRSPEAVDASR